MASKNRAALINKVLKVVKKHYKPAAPLEGPLAAASICCSRAAWRTRRTTRPSSVFQSLTSDYFDWNEVRVSTVRELAEVLQAAERPERGGDAAEARAAKRVRDALLVRPRAAQEAEHRRRGQAAREVQRQHAVRRGVRHAAGAGRALDPDRTRGCSSRCGSSAWSPTPRRPRASCRAWSGPCPRARAPRSARSCTSWASRCIAARTGRRFASCCWRSSPRRKDSLPKRPTKADEAPPARRPPAAPRRAKAAKPLEPPQEGGHEEARERAAGAKAQPRRRRPEQSAQEESRPPASAGAKKKADGEQAADEDEAAVRAVRVSCPWSVASDQRQRLDACCTCRGLLNARHTIHN